MAANYWESTQRRNWQFTKDELALKREQLEESEQELVRMYPLPEQRHLNIYFNYQLGRLGKRLGVRQQCLATAQMYLKRFYTKVEIRRTNPYLVITTALYLACKMEEAPQHIRLVVSESRSLWPVDFLSVDIARLGECEFWMISEMSSQLIIHQPYNTITRLRDEMSIALSNDEASLTTWIINDHYMTDLPLLYPPHIIAMTAILFALVMRPNPPAGQQTGNLLQMQSSPISPAAVARDAMETITRGGAPGQSRTPNNTSSPAGQATSMARIQRYVSFLADSSNVRIEDMIECSQELISFYDCQEQYNDKLTREQINRFVKARGLDKVSSA
ncbi:cyclin-C [Xylariaceae sp. FL1272]|nr:cyclin-C [Xylariaceae sp. FL1272]